MIVPPTNPFAGSNLAATLNEGVKVISQNQYVTFNLYNRYVLPVDGYVFWVKDSTTAPFNVQGSLHYSADQRQELDNTISYVNVTFTTPVQVNNLEEIQPGSLWIGSFDDFQFAFSSHDNYYAQANLWHYKGHAVYPEMRTQLVDSVSSLPSEPIVSNSLPIFLSLNSGTLPIYPSFLVPENISPPYAIVHIDEGSTSYLQPTPISWMEVDASYIYQLCHDKVIIYTYGLTNQQAFTFLQQIYTLAETNPIFGFMGGTIIKDMKHIQSEINVIAMQKKIMFDVSYDQSTVYDYTLKYITSVKETFYVQTP